MYGIYIVIVRNKDHFLFLSALITSLFLLLSNDDPKMGVIRGKSSDLISFVTSPVTFIKSLMELEERSQELRKENLNLALKVESMSNLKNEKSNCFKYLIFESARKFSMNLARVVNKGMQPNL